MRIYQCTATAIVAASTSHLVTFPFAFASSPHSTSSAAPEPSRLPGRRRVTPARFRGEPSDSHDDEAERRSRSLARSATGRNRRRARAGRAIRESEENREHRRAPARANYRARRDRELTAENADSHRDAVHAYNRARQQGETPLEAEARRQANRASSRVRREGETREEAEARREANRLSNRAR